MASQNNNYSDSTMSAQTYLLVYAVDRSEAVGKETPITEAFKITIQKIYSFITIYTQETKSRHRQQEKKPKPYQEECKQDGWNQYQRQGGMTSRDTCDEQPRVGSLEPTRALRFVSGSHNWSLTGNWIVRIFSPNVRNKFTRKLSQCDDTDPLNAIIEET